MPKSTHAKTPAPAPLGDRVPGTFYRALTSACPCPQTVTMKFSCPCTEPIFVIFPKGKNLVKFNSDNHKVLYFGLKISCMSITRKIWFSSESIKS